MVLLEGSQLEAFKGTIPSDQSFQKPIPPYPDSGVVYSGKGKDQSKQGNEFILKSQDPFCWVIDRNGLAGYDVKTAIGMNLFVTGYTLTTSTIADIPAVPDSRKIRLSEISSSPDLLFLDVFKEVRHEQFALPQPLKFKENLTVYFGFNVAAGELVLLQIFGFTEPI